jgi:ATP-binding cassette subfamily B protein
LILDEATSSLDSASERYVQKMIEILREQNKTVIIIAHRLSTVFQADKIVVLENGKVAEQGQHAELMLNKGAYYNLWKQQFPMLVEENT